MVMNSDNHQDPLPPSFLPKSFIGRGFVAILCVFVAGLVVQITRQSFFWNEVPNRPSVTDSRLHSRPIVERDGRQLLWARDDLEGDESEWFDVTDSKIDPEQFRHGIGKDTIASIDAPEFVEADHPRLQEHGISENDLVIGFVNDGDARAYPLKILNRHELVNDTVGGKPVTVGW